MSTKYDASTGTFIDDGVDDSPPEAPGSVDTALNGTQPPPVGGTSGYTAPLQKALAETTAAPGPALPTVDVDKIAEQMGAVGKPKDVGLPPVETPPLAAPVASPPIVMPAVASQPAAPGAPATAIHHTVLSPESQAALGELGAATAKESAATTALGETRGARADVQATGDQQRVQMDLQRQQRIQDRLAKAQADYDARVKEYDRQYAALKGMHETDFYADKSTGFKIAAAISIALGAVSQAFGGKNVGAELIGKEIEAHAARQRNEIVNQREIVEKAHVGTEGAKAEADRQSLLWETAAYDRAAHEVQARASQFGGQEERQKAAVVAAQLEAKSAEKKALLLKMTGEQVVTDTGRQTEADRLAAIAAQAKAKSKTKGTGGGGTGAGVSEISAFIKANPDDQPGAYALADRLGYRGKKGVDLVDKLQNDYTKAKANAAEDESTAVREKGADGVIRIVGHVPTGRGGAQGFATRDADYARAAKQLEALKKDIEENGERVFLPEAVKRRTTLKHNADIAVATVSPLGKTDEAMKAEAGSIGSSGAYSLTGANPEALDNKIEELKGQRQRYRDETLIPVKQVAAPSYREQAIGAAQKAQDARKGGAPAALPPGLPAGAKATGRTTKDGRAVYQLPGGGMVAG